MPKTVALVTIHGMGEQKPDYFTKLRDHVQREVGDAMWAKVSFRPVFYQDILQANEEAVWKRSQPHVGLPELRKFLLYGFSDAASLEHHQNAPGSPYLATQQRILAALDAVFAEAGGQVPVVLVAQSLGCQVMSSYIWDAQGAKPFAGVWKAPGPTGAAPGSPQDGFRRLKTAKRFVTTGCNIPIFLSGHAKIEAVASCCDGFEWHNYYDEQDVLGWPLRPLSNSYAQLVTDHPIRVGRSLWEKIKGTTPLSHTLYWTDKVVVRAVADGLRRFA